MAIKKRKNRAAQEETRFRIVDCIKSKLGTQKQVQKYLHLKHVRYAA
jgi:hypothetical protein